MNQLLMFWLVPAITLVIIGFLMNFYRIHFGSEKNLPRDQKISSYCPSPWCVIFSLIPVINIATIILVLVMLLVEDKRHTFL